MVTAFIRVLDAIEKDLAIRERAGPGGHAYRLDPERFRVIEGSPFAYWVGEGLRTIFEELEPFGAGSRSVKQGLITTDDFRFVRLSFEVPIPTSHRWPLYVKGGRFSRFYADIGTRVDWMDEGAQSRAILEARKHQVGGIIKNPGWYFRPGLTWPLRGVALSVQAVPSGCIFSNVGKMAFTNEGELLALLGLMNSRPFDALVGFFRREGRRGAV